MPLDIEHLVPKSRGGSDRVSTLTLACRTCNQAKDNRTAAEFGFPQVEAQGTQPLKDVAAVNASRWALYRRLLMPGLPVEVGTGGRTKWNRTRRGLPKTHWVDAACVGASTPEPLSTTNRYPSAIAAMGRESRQMCGMDRFGFPRTSAKRNRRVLGFQTGDLVRAVVTHGSKGGTYLGRVAVRATGSFNISTAHGTVQGIPATCCRVVHRADGYRYQTGEEALPPQA